VLAMEFFHFMQGFLSSGTLGFHCTKYRPIRFQVEQHEELITIKVNHISEQHNEKLAGIPTIIYRCQSVISNVERIYELKYELMTHKWFLYKM
jgi:hypothetical protein